MGSPYASYVFANFSRLFSFAIIFVFTGILSNEDMATIFLSKNVANAVVLLCSFGVHISYLRDKKIETIGASISILLVVIVLELIFTFLNLTDWSIIFFTLTAYYGLVLPSVPNEIIANIVGVVVSFLFIVAVILLNGTSLKIFFVTGSLALLIPICYRMQFLSVKGLVAQNKELFIGEMAPFVFGLWFVPSVLWFSGIEAVNIYGRVMMFVNIVLFPINGLKFFLLSRLSTGESTRYMPVIYISIGALCGLFLYFFKDFLGELNNSIISLYFYQIVVLILARLLSEIFQQKSYIRSSDRSRNIIIYIGYILRFITVFMPSAKQFILALCIIEIFYFILFYVLDFYYSDNRIDISI